MTLFPFSLTYRLACWQVVRRPSPSYVTGRLLLSYPADRYTLPSMLVDALQKRFREITYLSCTSEVPVEGGLTLPAPGWTGLLSGTAIRELQAIQPEVVIHLDSRFHLAAEHALAMLPARLHVGFYHPLAEPFYDVLLATHGESVDACVQVLLRYLEHVVGSSLTIA